MGVIGVDESGVVGLVESGVVGMVGVIVESGVVGLVESGVVGVIGVDESGVVEGVIGSDESGIPDGEEGSDCGDGIVLESGVKGVAGEFVGDVESGNRGVEGTVEGCAAGAFDGISGIVVGAGESAGFVIEESVGRVEGRAGAIVESAGWLIGIPGVVPKPAGVEGIPKESAGDALGVSDGAGSAEVVGKRGVVEVGVTGFSVGTDPFTSFEIDSTSAATGSREPAKIAATLAAAIGFNMLTFISK
ncbi:hypothetical protein [Myxacorys almedinensis]|uniref:hypothetical protein n=1 Tax=Myxacorys almedinensis TaxID=2651157 RepID=UPI001EE43B97|nr:hypothetical protein [Myxacorys almedinensis]